MHETASQKSVSDTLYPVIAPFDQRMISVPGGHQVYVEQCGNPTGQPVIVLHGGPGGGCSPAMRRFFDPEHYRVVLFDQRGCGRSRPHASVENNTTWDLVADIEKIRVLLGIERWMVFGGSWGATLSLIYAQAHPERVQALILRGVFLGTEGELDWFYRGGAAAFWPEEWAKFEAPIPADERGDLIAAYARRLFSEDVDEQTAFARTWSAWESALAVLEPGEGRGSGPADYARAFARLENHYFHNRVFLNPDQAILNNLDRLAGIPGVIVQGRYDMICPPARAYALAAGWRDARLVMVPTAGHALSEPGITLELVRAMDQLRQTSR
jgi:proline iminopeptidase